MVELGSFTKDCVAGQELVGLIFSDIEAKTGVKSTNNVLRHVAIYGADGAAVEVNGFPFHLFGGAWSSPNNDCSTLVAIKSIKPLQAGSLTIYYLR